MHCATSCCVQLQFPNARTQELAHADINSTQQVFFFSTCFLIFVDELNSHPRSRACFFSNSASKNGPHIFFPPHFVQNYSLHMPAVSPIILINFRYYLWRVSVGSGPSMVRPATNTKKHILAEKKHILPTPTQLFYAHEQPNIHHLKQISTKIRISYIHISNVARPRCNIVATCYRDMPCPRPPLR